MAAEQAPAVLVVDDDAAIREAIGRFLQKWGYQAVAADSIARAREILGSTAVHALILDIRLKDGGWSGIDLLMSLRQRPELAGVPVVMMTGGMLTEAEERAITAQRAHLFYKPEGFDAIVTFLDQLTGRDRSH
jgi:DNA-binding NtrC family response regulator